MDLTSGFKGNGEAVALPLDRLAKLYIEPTNRCNLDCRTCMRHGWDENLGYMEFGLFEKILDGLHFQATMPAIFFGGFGEPLVHPDIVVMVAKAKAAGARVELISNGILLSDELASRLVTAGLDFLWLSIDGASPQSYADIRLGNHLPQILANLRRLRRQRIFKFGQTPELGISFVAMKRNIADLPQVLDLGLRLGATSFSVSNIEAYTAAMDNELLYSHSLTNPAHLRQLEMPRMDLGTENGDVLKRLIGRFTLPGLMGAKNADHLGTCPFLERGSASVRWDGQVSPCLPLLHAHTVYTNGYSRLWQEFHIASAMDRDFGDIWNDKDYRTFRKKLLDFSFAPCTMCNSCDLPNLNGEDCYGNVHPACGGCLWSQGFIQCP